MATRQGTIDLLLDQARGAGSVTARKMFGEYGLYCDGKLVALVCDEHLFVKPTTAGRTHMGTVIEAPPYPGAKPYFLVPGEAWEEADWLTDLIRVTAASLPERIAKGAKRARSPGATVRTSAPEPT